MLEPEKRISPTRSLDSIGNSSFILFLAHVNRFGAQSAASILREISRAINRSRPSCSTTSSFLFHIGRSNAKKIPALAILNKIIFITTLGKEQWRKNMRAYFVGAKRLRERITLNNL